MTVSLNHDSDETMGADANTVVGKLNGNVGDERQDYAVLEIRPTTIPILVVDYSDLLPSTDHYFWEVNEHAREFFTKNDLTQNDNEDFSKLKRAYPDCSRSLTAKMFYREMSNGEKVRRYWLVYSVSQRKSVLLSLSPV